MSSIFQLARSERWMPVTVPSEAAEIRNWRVELISPVGGGEQGVLYDHISHCWKQRKVSNPPVLPSFETSFADYDALQNDVNDAAPPAETPTAALAAAVSMDLPCVVLPVLESVDVAAVSRVAHRHGLSSHHVVFTAMFAFLWWEAEAQKRVADTLSGLAKGTTGLSGVRFPHEVMLVVNELHRIWVERRVRTVTPRYLCGVPACVVAVSREHFSDSQHFVPFSTATKEADHPMRLPASDALYFQECISLQKKIFSAFEHSDVFHYPLERFAAEFPSLHHLCASWPTAACLPPWSADLETSALTTAEAANYVAVQGFRHDGQRFYIDRGFRAPLIALLEQAAPNAWILCRDKRIETLFVEGAGVVPRQYRLFAVFYDGSSSMLICSADLGAPLSLEAPSDASWTRWDDIPIDICRTIVDRWARKAVLQLLKVVAVDEVDCLPLLLVLQRHPSVVYLKGCGIQTLEVSADGKLHTRLICGNRMCWDYRECYEAIGSRTRLRDEVSFYHAQPDALPHIGKSRLTLTWARGILCHTWQEMQKAGLRKEAFHPRDQEILMAALRSHPAYYSDKRGCGVKYLFAALSSNPLKADRPTVHIHRVCGTTVEFTLASCFTADGQARLPKVVIAQSDRKRPREEQFDEVLDEDEGVDA